MKKLLLTFALMVSLNPNQSWSQNYDLKVSSLIETCDFIHKDEFSFAPILTLIQEHLKTKLEGDKECIGPMAQLNGQLIQLDAFFSAKISEKDKKLLSQDAQRQYLSDLMGEMATLDPSVPADAARISLLQSITDNVKAGLTTIGVESSLAALEDDKNKQQQISDYWEQVYNQSSVALASLNSMPDKCVDKIGGWKQLAPAVLNLASLSGPVVGGTIGSVVSVAFKVGSQLAVLMQNNKLKRAISEISRIQNQQIIACSYLALQSNACELKRAYKLMDNKKIYELLNQEFKDPKFAEYERYFRVIQSLSKIQSIFNDIGSMGSALTLNLELLIDYFAAVKLQPENIEIPPAESSDTVISTFIIKMKGRGLSLPDFDQNRQPVPLRQRYNNAVLLIKQAIQVIEAVKGVLTANRSFVDLKEEIITKNQYSLQELKFFRAFIQFHLKSEKLLPQYRSIFQINEKMLNTLIDFVGADIQEGEDINAYRLRINQLGVALFDEMSVGSVAQITSQSVLMIPAIAFERFNRPIKALEHMYVANDIIFKDDPDYPVFTDFVINRSLQMKLIHLYQDLNGSSKAFRLETYLAALDGISKGFKRDIIKLVKNSMNAKSETLPELEGTTAAQMCALFTPFLREQSDDLFKRCQANYKKLELNPIMKEVNRPTEMKIDYADNCFYNNYKREERGQRRLFEKLIDYGSRNNLVWD
jgi:hypothetical protein